MVILKTKFSSNITTLLQQYCKLSEKYFLLYLYPVLFQYLKLKNCGRVYDGYFLYDPKDPLPSMDSSFRGLNYIKT